MPDGTPQIERNKIGLQTREAPITTVDTAKRTASLIWSTGAKVRRYDWQRDRYYMEELSLASEHVRMGRLSSGSAPLLNNHSAWRGLEDVIGVVDTASLSPSATAEVRFSSRDDVAPIVRDVADKIIRNVSVGYIVHRYDMLPPDVASPNGDWTYRAVDWEPYELSLVTIPADAGAQVRGEGGGNESTQTRAFECEFFTPAAAADFSQRKQEPQMTQATTAPAADPNAGQPPVDATRIAQEAVQAERERVTSIQSRCKSVGLDDAFAQKLVDDGTPFEAACRAMVDAVAAKQTPPPIATRATVVEDERVKLRTFIGAAISHRASPTGALLEGAGDFRYMSMSRLAEEVLHREGVNTRGMSNMEIVSRSMLATSDFPNILLDAANKRLRAAYVENEQSYQRWARRAPNAPDFKNINVLQLGGAPSLLPVLEGGEFKRGSMTDGKETYTILTFGRVVPITRQAIINDDLSAFDRVPMAMAGAARRLENRTIYDIFTTNANLSDGLALFGTGHANLGTGAGTALAVAPLTAARAAMRKQKGYQNEELNIAPSYLIVPADLEQTAYQLTSSQYVPATAQTINEFRAGGKTALEPIVEAYLSATSTTRWYLAANASSAVDTVEYCYLEGSEGLYLENRVGFDVDGIEFKGRLDFAAKAIDFRGLYRADGA